MTGGGCDFHTAGEPIKAASNTEASDSSTRRKPRLGVQVWRGAVSHGGRGQDQSEVPIPRISFSNGWLMWHVTLVVIPSPLSPVFHFIYEGVRSRGGPLFITVILHEETSFKWDTEWFSGVFSLFSGINIEAGSIQKYFRCSFSNFRNWHNLTGFHAGFMLIWQPQIATPGWLTQHNQPGAQFRCLHLFTYLNESRSI